MMKFPAHLAHWRLQAISSIAGAIVTILAVAAPAWIDTPATGSDPAATVRSTVDDASHLVLSANTSTTSASGTRDGMRPVAEGTETSEFDHEIAATSGCVSAPLPADNGRASNVYGVGEKLRSRARSLAARGPPQV